MVLRLSLQLVRYVLDPLSLGHPVLAYFLQGHPLAHPNARERKWALLPLGSGFNLPYLLSLVEVISGIHKISSDITSFLNVE